MKRKIINRSVSFLKKNGVYVFYTDFIFIFLKGRVAKFMDTLLANIGEDGGLKTYDIPENFVQYLVSRKIIVEEEQNEP